jgi:hypothetical protein
MEVADTEAAVTLVGATSAAVTLVEVTSAETGPMCTLAVIASPEAATSGMIAAVGLAGMAPATRTEGLTRTATGRNELKPTGVLNLHLASHESSLTDNGRAIRAGLRDHHERGRREGDLARLIPDHASELPVD